MEANVNKQVDSLDTVRSFLDELRGAWAEAAQNAGYDSEYGSTSAGINIAG